MLPRRVESLCRIQRRYLSTQGSYLQRVRRVRDKINLKPPQDMDAPILKFPYDRLGCDIVVNWTFAQYGVAPLNATSFHNLHNRHLEMHSTGKPDQFKALHVQTDAAQNLPEYFVQTGHYESFISGNNQIDEETWEKLMSEVTVNISESPSLFMTDAAVGDNREVETRFRIISGDPNASLYLKHLLAPCPADVQNFRHHVVVHHAPNFVSPLTGGKPFVLHMLLNGGHALAKMDPLQAELYTAEDRATMSPLTAGLVIVGGTDSHTVLRQSLTTMSDYFQLQKQQLPLYASIYGAPGQAALIFDPQDNLLKGHNEKVASNHHCVWTANGLYSSFRGVTHGNLEEARVRGALVSTAGNSKSVTIPGQAHGGFGQPKAIIFLVDDAASPQIASLAQSAALSLFAKNGGYKLSAALKEQTQKGFFQLLTDSKAPVYALNTNGLPVAKRDELVAALASGNVKGLEIKSIKEIK